jgi:peptidoglycan/LPS O-acetylase OafA/YrhL
VNPLDLSASPPHAVAPRNVALDGLRGVAIAMVLWHHFIQQHLPTGRSTWLGWLNAGTELSWSGVDLFFTLSGFFIGGILIDHRDSPRMKRVFYLRRAARILPLYYLTLAVFALAILGNLPGSFHLFPAWVYVLFLTNFATGFVQNWDWLPLARLWSLAVEEQFYITAPWVVRAIAPSRIPQVTAGLFLAAELARAGFLWIHPGGHLALAVLTPFRMDDLALGVLVAWAVRNRAGRSFLERLGRHWGAWLAAGGVLFSGLVLLRPQAGSPLLSLLGYPVIAAVFALILAVVVQIQPSGLNRCLEVRPLVHLGRHSYFIYLWHGLLGGAMIRWLGGTDFVLNSFAGLGLVAMAVTATWIASVVSWRWFESPILRWGNRHSY